MQQQKINILVIFGGKSAEHEVSLVSAASVLQNLDQARFNVRGVAIDSNGQFFLHGEKDFSVAALKKTIADKEKEIYLLPGKGSESFALLKGGKLSPLKTDLVFPLLHGSFGEDGTIQGLLAMLDLPYVGCGVLASALAMDKGLAKEVMQQQNLPLLPSLVISQEEWQEQKNDFLGNLKMTLAYPIFVKPCNLGSSIGISKVTSDQQLKEGIEEAFCFDQRVIIEQGIDAREIEVSVLGGKKLQASLPGEVIPQREFYDYQAKYLDQQSKLSIPADLPQQLTEHIQDLALQAFWAIGGSGMGRVDFLLERSSLKPYISEINTIPGFTAISMYPKLWQATGLNYQELLAELAEIALTRHSQEKELLRKHQGETI